MKIIVLTDGIYPYVIGGMQNHSFFLVKHLLKNNHDVLLCHCVLHIDPLPEQGKTKELLDVDGGSRFEEEIFRFPAPGKLPGHYIRNSYSYSERLFEALKTKFSSADLIIAQGFSAWKLLEEKAKGFKCPPVAVHFHGLNMFQKTFSIKGKLEQLLFRGPVKYNIHHADIVLSYGGKIQEIYRSLNIPQSKMIMLPNGIEEKWFSENKRDKSSSKRKLLFVGRYERLKGIEELNVVLPKLSGLDFQFDFIGKLPDKVKIRHSSVFYHGAVDNTTLERKFSEADVLVCPSWSEGMPTVLLEAMAKGIAIIATDTGAVSDMVSESNGWLIDPGNSEQLLLSLKEAIQCSDEVLAKKKSSSIDKAYSKFRWEVIIKKFITDVGTYLNSRRTM